MIHNCPNCGWKPKKKGPLAIGDWWLTPTFATYKGELQPLPPGQAKLLYTVATAYGEPVSSKALLKAISPNSTPTLIAVYMDRMRKTLGPIFPLKRHRSIGIYWSAGQ